MLAIACSTTPRHPYTIAGGHEGAVHTHTILLLPLNVSIALPGELEEASPRVERMIGEFVASLDKDVKSVEFFDARAAWTAAAKKVRTESEDEEDFGRVAEQFALVLHEAYPFDALVMPSLIFREARIYQGNRSAVWDGVERDLKMVEEARVHGGFHLMTTIGGKIPGVSLHVMAYDSTGARVFNSLAGIDLVHDFALVSEGQQLRDLKTLTPLRSERLTDESAIRAGIRMAFDPYLVPPVSSAEERP